MWQTEYTIFRVNTDVANKKKKDWLENSKKLKNKH